MKSPRIGLPSPRLTDRLRGLLLLLLFVSTAATCQPWFIETQDWTSLDDVYVRIVFPPGCAPSSYAPPQAVPPPQPMVRQGWIKISSDFTCDGTNRLYTLEKNLGRLPPGSYDVEFHNVGSISFPLLTPALATAQFQVKSNVEPYPAIAGQPLRLTAWLPFPDCPDDFEVRSVTRAGREVLLDYVITPPTGSWICFATPQAIRLDHPIGSFEPGAYTFRLRGSYHGSPVTPITGSFYVWSTSPGKSYQGLWWNAPAGSEAGWGIHLAHQGEAIFATWFTYDAARRPTWFTASALKVAEGTYQGSLQRTNGPPFDSVPFPSLGTTRQSVGTMTLEFDDADHGRFSYTLNGVSQTKSIQRQVFGATPQCTLESFQSFLEPTEATNLTDLWWAAGGAESGWGMSVADQRRGTSATSSVLFAVWFTYDRDREPVWFTFTATFDNRAGAFSGDLYRFEGPSFSTVPFPAQGEAGGATGTIVGSASFVNAIGVNKAFTYTLGGVTQTKTIQRQVFAVPRTVCMSN